MYHAYDPPTWGGPTGFYHTDHRTVPAPAESQVWESLYLWAGTTYVGGDTMYFSLQPDSTYPPPADRRYFLELVAVPDGVVGAPPVGTVWELPLQLFTLELPTFRTDDGLEGYRFTFTIDEVVSIPGDFDKDGDVDEDDFYAFEQCFTGSDSGPIGSACGPGDFDDDDDIDCDDWDQFQIAWTEPGDPPILEACYAECGNGICEEGEDIGCPSDCDCLDDSDCDDDHVCTVDQCMGNVCSYTPGTYGDVDHNEAVNIFDFFCVLNAVGGEFETCSFKDVDIEPCAGNGFIDVLDLFAVLNAFSGQDPCCGGLPRRGLGHLFGR